MYIFYPSCNYAIDSRENAQKLRAFMKGRMQVAGCCLVDKRGASCEDIGIYMCQNCRSTIENKVKTMSLWEYLLEIEYPLPDYHGEKMVLQDCWRDRNHPEVHMAVRELMRRMHIEIVEMKENREKAKYCGTLHYETNDAYLSELLQQYPDKKLSALPQELQVALMKDNFKGIDEDLPIVVDCNRCKKGAELAERKVVHLMDLIMKD